MFKEVPAQFDFPASEAEILRFWGDQGIYEKSLARREGCPSFVFYEGPPTANGLPHPGHCLTRIIKDVFPRYKTMTGHYCHRKGGWDTHGLPVEAEVCKELGIHTKDEIEQYGIEKFIKLCRESVFRYTKEWEELTRRLGFWINLEEAYVTYHQSYVESVWWALKTLFDKGLLYQGHKVVWWWPQGGTALYAGEVGQGYREIDDPSIFVKFPLAEQDEKEASHSDRRSLLIWTTTPWTLVSNHFVAVHPDVDYALVEDTGNEGGETEHFYIAKELVETVARKVKRELRTISVCKGTDLVGLRYIPPFRETYYDKPAEYPGRVFLGQIPEGPYQDFRAWQEAGTVRAKAPFGEHRVPRTKREPNGGYKALLDEPYEWIGWRVTPADFVTIDNGTGLVHVAPAFGEEDFTLWSALSSEVLMGLPLLNAVLPNGDFGDEAPTQYRGRWVKDCDKEIIREMRNERTTSWGSPLLYHQEQVRHDYPFCWRAEDDPLIQYARKSWFIRTTEFRDSFLENNAKINWLPEHIRDGRFGNFLEDNVDWALSRERFWGTPLPIWQCEKTGKQEAIASYAELTAKPGMTGTEVWENAKRQDPDLIDDLKVHKPYIDAITYESPFAEGARMRRVPEVIDCWFDSGCMPFAQWGYPHGPSSAELFKQRFPADFISEAIDQTRGWFYTLLAISTMLFSDQSGCGTGVSPVQSGTQHPSRTSTGETPVPHTFPRHYPHPFRNCIVLGLVAGEDGKKLSKSKRNYKDPSHIFDCEGADAMRWSMLSSQAPWTGVRFKEETIATDQREFLIKLYNVYSFFVIYANIDKWEPVTGGEQAREVSELDRWMLAELNQTIADVRAAMDRYENYPACRRLVEFVDALSNWYVRRSRDRFWRPGMDADKDAAYQTLWACMVESSKLIAPFTPFLAETLYQNLYQPLFADAPESVHLCDYPRANEAAIDQTLMEEMAVVREIASLGRSARMDARIKVRQPLAVVELVLADPSHQQWLEGHLTLIADELNVKRVEFVTDADKYVTYEIKPNFKSLGPKFGKLAPKIKQALSKADAATLRHQLEEQGKTSIEVDGQTVELTRDDVQVALKAREGWAAAQGQQVVVVLSIELTDELRAEGMARDLVHLIQNARKAEKLDYQARIRLRVNASGVLADAIKENQEYIRNETLAKELTIDPGVTDAPHSGEIEGATVQIELAVIA